mgnify:CR=1 FL=1
MIGLSDQDIVRLFYDCIIKEATTGRIDSYRYYNLPFHTVIRSKEGEKLFRVDRKSPYLEDTTTFPTLFINNVELFNQLLVEYVHKALLFYGDRNFYEEVLDGSQYEETKMISKEKCIICALLANMGYYDFINPYRFLENRISMFDHPSLDTEEEIDLGYVESFKGRIIIQEVREKMDNETPYVLKIRIHSDELDEDYYLPDVRIGNCDKYSIIYAIQREKYNERDGKYVKYLDRKLRGVDQGLDVKNETYENYGDGNLKDITPSFLIAALIGCLVSRNQKIEIVPALIERWNAKRIATRVKADRKQLGNEFIIEEDKKQEKLQDNLTQKFLRLFWRLDYHFDGMEYHDKDILHEIMLSSDIHTDNMLLQEVMEVIQGKNREKVLKSS